MWLWAILIAISSFFWVPLLFERVSIRTKIALSVAGIVFEEGSWALSTSPLFVRLLRSDHEPASYTIHEQERYTSIYIMGLAQFVFRLIVSSPITGINTHLLLAIWTLMSAFGLNWMYVNGDGALQPRHPLTYSFPVVMQWLFLHNPLLASLLAGGQVAVADSTVLTEGAESSRGHNINNNSNNNNFTAAHSWILCGGLSFSVLILYIFANLAGSVELAGLLILPKQMRIIMRPVIGLAMLLLPLAHDRLSFIKTLSITMSLIIFCVMWECVTSLQSGVGICESWIQG
jgi:hypothetical protein